MRTALTVPPLAVGLAASVAAAAFVSPATAMAAERACGDVQARGDMYANLRVDGASCRAARAVVRGWARTDSSITGWRRLDRPAGWRCRYLIRPVRFVCASSRATVRFDPGPGF